MAKSFTKFKDRIWGVVDLAARGVASAPKPIQDMGYGTLRGLLWAAYHAPKVPLKSTAADFATVLGHGTARSVYGGFVDRFVWALRRQEKLRLGATEETDALLELPEQDRLDEIIRTHGSTVMAMPHCHSSLLMIRGLSTRYPVLMLVRESADKSRADATRVYYNNLGAERLDVRNSSSVSVARSVLRALREGKLVVGIVDRIKAAPADGEDYNAHDDVNRCQAFGQTVGFPAWPARFAARAGVPLLPVMVELTQDKIVGHLGDAIDCTDQMAATQACMDALETMFRQYPHDWGFVYDKHWSRVMRAKAQEMSPTE